MTDFQNLRCNLGSAKFQIQILPNPTQNHHHQDLKRKKGKGKEGKQGKMIRNEAVSSRLQISRSDYDDNLANLKHKGNRPAKCVKWHCRGVYFDQCKGVIKGRDGHDPLSKAEEEEMFKFLQINGLRK